MLEKVDMPNFKVYFDTQNPQAEKGYYAPDMIQPLKDFICEVHAKDGREITGNRLLGAGTCDAILTLKKIKDTGYSGYVHLESTYNNIGKGDRQRALDAITLDIGTLKNIFES